MSVSTAVRSRVVRWRDVLGDFGYVEVDAPRPVESDGDLVIRASRVGGADRGPTVVVSIRELWTADRPPVEVLEEDGAFLAASSWHAQIGGDAPEDADRIDVDPFKPPALWIHRHPLYSPNHVRLPLTALPDLASWLMDIEQMIYRAWYED